MDGDSGRRDGRRTAAAGDEATRRKKLAFRLKADATGGDAHAPGRVPSRSCMGLQERAH